MECKYEVKGHITWARTLQFTLLHRNALGATQMEVVGTDLSLTKLSEACEDQCLSAYQI